MLDRNHHNAEQHQCTSPACERRALLAAAISTAALAAMAPIASAQEASTASTASSAEQRLAAHVEALRNQGQAPLEFVLKQLRQRDLIIFDDGLHTAADPFDFYIELVREPAFQELSPIVFLEVIPSNRQGAIDDYYSTFPEDQRLLYPAFQDDFGWPYQSYFDLLHAIYVVNCGLPAERRIKVVPVSTPSMWGEIKTLDDWNRSVDTRPLARDYFMYAMIRQEFDNFDSGRKGVFLTNTRHAYVRLRAGDGSPVRSAAAFFELWHPGHVFSVRFNTPALIVSAPRVDAEGTRTAEGLEDYQFHWGRVAGGLWDEAFTLADMGPRAVPLAGTVFGEAPYVGNLMLSVAPGQSMSDAYDAVVFLRPIEELEATALTNAIYTAQFRRELARRYRVSRSRQQLRQLLAENDVHTVADLIEIEARSRPRARLAELAGLTPVGEWRND